MNWRWQSDDYIKKWFIWGMASSLYLIFTHTSFKNTFENSLQTSLFSFNLFYNNRKTGTCWPAGDFFGFHPLLLHLHLLPLISVMKSIKVSTILQLFVLCISNCIIVTNAAFQWNSQSNGTTQQITFDWQLLLRVTLMRTDNIEWRSHSDWTGHPISGQSVAKLSGLDGRVYIWKWCHR